LPAVPEIFFRAARVLTLVTRPLFFCHGPPPLGDRGLPPRGVPGPTRPRPSTLKGRGNGVPYAFSPEEHGRLNPAFERTFGAMASPVAFNAKFFTHVLFPRRLPAALVGLTNLPV
jgi:hypothetical protein